MPPYLRCMSDPSGAESCERVDCSWIIRRRQFHVYSRHRRWHDLSPRRFGWASSGLFGTWFGTSCSRTADQFDYDFAAQSQDLARADSQWQSTYFVPTIIAAMAGKSVGGYFADAVVVRPDFPRTFRRCPIVAEAAMVNSRIRTRGDSVYV